MKNSFYIQFFFIFLAALCILQPDRCFALQSGAKFLEVPVSVKAEGMGGSFTAIADDAFGINYNPAGMEFIERTLLAFSYQRYFKDFSSENLGFVRPFRKFRIGTTFSHHGMRREPIYDAFGNDTGGEFGYSGVVLPLAVSFSIRDYAIGASAKYYYEKIDDYSDYGITADIGGIYSFEPVRFGVSINNVFGTVGGYRFPAMLRAGAAFKHDDIIISLDLVSHIYKKESYYNFGAQYILAEDFFLRVGYKSRESMGGLSAGFGVIWNKLIFDYAFAGYGDLGSMHRLGVSMPFD